MAEIDTNDMKTNGHIAYGLCAAGVVTGGVATIAGIIFCYMKRKDFTEHVWTSHMTWLIRTFWISLIIFLVSIPLALILIGGLTGLAGGVWFLYRIIKGWIFWNDGKVIENPGGFF